MVTSTAKPRARPKAGGTRSGKSKPAEAAVWTGGVNPWLIAVTVTLATFMEVLDTSIANVALPHIAGALSAGVDESTWVLTSYLVSNAIILPLSGWLASAVGRKRFYMSCVALFTVSSFLCGLAPNLPALIFFRVLQGLGGGGLAPSEQSILADTFTPAKRGMAFALYGLAVVFAPAIGPTLGGWITDNYSWRWIFYINVPIGLLSLFLTHAFVSDSPALDAERKRLKRKGWHVDFVGLLLVALGLGALQIMLDKGEREDWFASHLIQVTATLSVVGVVGTIIWELLHPHPVVNLRLLGERNFATANLLMLMLGFVLLGSTVLIPQMTQQVFGYTATLAGLVISPGGVAIMCVMPIVGFLIPRVDARWLIIFGLVLSGTALIFMSGWSLDDDFKTLAVGRIFQSSGIGFLFIPITNLSYSFIPPGQSNAASGLINLSRNIGGAVGISIMTSYLTRRTQVHQSYLVTHITAYAPAATRTLAATASGLRAQGLSPSAAAHANLEALSDQVVRQAAMLAYADCFRFMAMFSFGAILLTLLLKKPKPGTAVVME